MYEMASGKLGQVPVPGPFASVVGLGEPRRVYDSGGLERLTHLLFSLAGMAFALATFLYALAIFSRQFSQAPRQYLAFPLGFSILLFLFAFLWFRRITSRWNECIVLYSKGIAHYDGRRILMFRWDEISAVFTGGNVRSPWNLLYRESHTYRLLHQNGRTLELNKNLKWVDELYEEIRRAVYRPILTRCCTAFDSGETVQFGPLGVSRDLGMVAGGKEYRWDEISQVGIRNGRLQIKPKGSGWTSSYSAPLGVIPNLDVFLAMVNELAGLSQPSPTA